MFKLNTVFRFLSWFVLRIRRSCIRQPLFRSRLLALAKYRFPLRDGGRSVRRLTYSTVLKTGSSAQIQAEVYTMRFVAAHTTIPIPHIHDHWSEGSKGFIVMEYLPGVTARRVFANLNAEQQHHILDTLVSYVEQLRSIPHPCPPNPWIGTASGRAFWDPVVSDEDPEDGWGPYVDLAAFNDARVALFDKFARIHPPIADQLRAYRRDMRDDLPVVFTHADIHRENVLLKQSSDGTQVDVLALLDWGCAGWRPIFWEGYKSAWLGHNFKVWGELGPRLFAGYEGEVELEKTLLQVNGGMPP